MKAITEVWVQLSSRPWMMERDSICCSSVLDLDEPSLSQYSGRLLEGCKDSSKENSGSILNVVVPVSEVRSSSCS